MIRKYVPGQFKPESKLLSADATPHPGEIIARTGTNQYECEDAPMKKSRLRSAMLLMLGIIFLFFTACGPGGSGESASSGSSGGGGDGDADDTPVAAAYTLSGSVYDANGNPVSGATVAAFSDPETTTTSSSGGYSFDLCAAGADCLRVGDHTVVVYASGTSQLLMDSFALVSVDSATENVTNPPVLLQTLPIDSIPIIDKDADGVGQLLTSNTINNTTATLLIPTQHFDHFTVAGDDYDKLTFFLDYLDPSKPFSFPLPSEETRSADLNAAYAFNLQTPSVVVNVRPALLEDLNPGATLTLPNPHGLPNATRVLHFDAENHLWVDTNQTLGGAMGGMPITEGGLYGVFEEAEADLGTVVVNVTGPAGTVVFIGDKSVVTTQENQNDVRVWGVPVPLGGGAIDAFVLDSDGN